MVLRLQSRSETTLTNAEKVTEWLRCKEDPIYFINQYVKIQDRAGLKTIPFRLWDFQKRTALIILSNYKTITLKARQLGWTWLVEALVMWLTHFFENASVLELSYKEDEAFKLIDKCRFINDNLPDFLRLPLLQDQSAGLKFGGLNSEIRALPSTAEAGRSTDASWVVTDELEFHPYAESNFASLNPTIGTQGKYIIGSTADTERTDTFFKRVYRSAKAGENSFVPIFLSALSRPDRTRKELDILMRDMPAHKVQGEYPLTEDDALSIVKTRKFFDDKILEAMLHAQLKPLAHQIVDKYQTVTIYKMPIVGRRYCVFTDPSDGKEDPHAIIVMDSVTGEQVAESHGKITADRVAVVHDALSRMYNDALNGYELNARAGGIMTEKLKELGTPNQCDFLDNNGKLNKKRGKGWWTAPHSDDKFLYPLEESVRMQQITIHSPECIDEFRQYYVPEGKSPCHPEGGHDDYISAWGRVLYLRRFIQTNLAEPFSFKYRE